MQNTFRDNVLLFLPLNKIWVVMLPSVTRSHPLSSQGADHAPCPAGAFSGGSWALSAAPDSGCFPAHPTHASAKDAHLCPPGFSPACQCPPDCLHWNGPRRHSTSPLSSLPFSPMGHVPRCALHLRGPPRHLPGCPRHRLGVLSPSSP